jgi:hypothetical protein
MIKVPKQFLELTRATKGMQLDEDFGEKLAQWAAGGEVTRGGEIRAAIRAAETLEDLETLKPQLEEARKKKTVPGPEWNELVAYAKLRRDELVPPEPGSAG